VNARHSTGRQNRCSDNRGRLYATARVRVLLEDYAAQWDALVGDWLPGSGYKPYHRPAMEFYLNNPDADPEGRRVSTL